MNISNTSIFLQSRYNEKSNFSGLQVDKFVLANALVKRDENPDRKVVVFQNESVALMSDTVERIKEKFQDSFEYEDITFLTGKSGDLLDAWSDFVKYDLQYGIADEDSNGELTVAESLNAKTEIGFDSNYNSHAISLRLVPGVTNSIISALESDNSSFIKTEDAIDYHLFLDENLDGKITEQEMLEQSGIDIQKMREAEKAYRNNEGTFKVSTGNAMLDDLLEKLDKLNEKKQELEMKLQKAKDPLQSKELSKQIEMISQQITVIQSRVNEMIKT